jgi:hypothetical protein
VECAGPNSVSDEINDSLCFDKEENCGFWASKGECSANPGYMHLNCAKSCGTCKIQRKKEEKRKILILG